MGRDRYDDDDLSPGPGRFDNYDDYPEEDYFRPRYRKKWREDDDVEEQDEDDISDKYLRKVRRPKRSGMITATAVINLVAGGLVLLFGSCYGFSLRNNRTGGLFRGASDLEIVITVVVYLLIVAWGSNAIAAGVGLLKRQAWARVITLILGGFACLAGLYCIFAGILALLAGSRRPDLVVPATWLFVLCFILALVCIAYFIWTFIILFSSQYRSEFRWSLKK